MPGVILFFGTAGNFEIEQILEPRSSKYVSSTQAIHAQPLTKITLSHLQKKYLQKCSNGIMALCYSRERKSIHQFTAAGEKNYKQSYQKMTADVIWSYHDKPHWPDHRKADKKWKAKCEQCSIHSGFCMSDVLKAAWHSGRGRTCKFSFFDIALRVPSQRAWGFLGAAV